MAALTVLAILAIVIVLVGAACGIAAIVQLGQVKDELAELKRSQIRPSAAVNTPDPEQSPERTSAQFTAEPIQEPQVFAEPTTPIDLNPLNPLAVLTTDTAAGIQNNAATAEPQSGVFSSLSAWIEDQLIKRGMVWLGAIALALGGIFLVKHSLDSGWLSPALRTITGAIFGLLLLAASEWLHKRSQGHLLTNYAPAALSSGGFISLYAATLVAFDWYQLISPALAFPLLAVIALAASWLSLRQGPVLAFIGIIGAYAVPVLVSTGSDNVVALLAYVSVVTLSSVLVEQRVKRSWLWYLPMTAHLFWLAASLFSANDTELQVFWFVLCASLVLLAWLPVVGFRFSRLQLEHQPLRSWWPFSRELCLAIAMLLLALFALTTGAVPGFVGMLLFIVLLQSFAASNSKNEVLLWLSALPALFWLVLEPLTLSQDPYVLNSTRQYQHLLLIALCSLPLAALVLRLPWRLHWSSALAILPALLLGLSHAQASVEVQQHIQLIWTLVALMLVALQSWMSLKTRDKAAAFILMAGANFALTLCFTFWLSDAALTLAIAAQLVLLTLLGRRMQMPVPFWLIKLIVAVVLLRLTSAPLLGNYEGTLLLGLHWSFVVYPLALLCFALSWYLWSATEIKGWLEGALLHLVAVFVTVQTQYWLNAGEVELLFMDFTTKTVHAFNWLLLALVYQWRSHKAGHLARLYRLMATGLVLMTIVAHLDLSLFSSPLIQHQDLGITPVFNLLLVLWGLPALLCHMLSRYCASLGLKNLATYTSIAGAVLFIVATIRHYWQHGQLLLSLPTSVAEQYSYSLVFLLIAIITVLLAQWRNKTVVRKAGFVLLSAVVLKVFIVDLEDLTGMLRALSFIGLGLSLVLLGWLFQRLQKPDINAESP
jgi:uncharacterized membrane protein